MKKEDQKERVKVWQPLYSEEKLIQVQDIAKQQKR